MNKLNQYGMAAWLLCVQGAATGAQIEWEGWAFDYSIDSNASGLVISELTYNDKEILFRAAMPVMRVKYENNACGPYADILSTHVSKPATQGAPNDACANKAVCTRTFELNGEKMFEVGSNWQIGEYQIYQTYYFSDQGYFDSRVYSRGLQCQVDHAHHAHWLFDFDIDGHENDKIVFPDGSEATVEFNDVKSNTASWTIADTQSSVSATLTPSADDGVPDSFSKVDFIARAYNSGETGRWNYGAYGEIGEFFLNNQSVNDNDIVVWYVSHLAHSAAEGSAIWHASGPRITVKTDTAPIDPPVPPPEPPEPEGNNLLSNGGFESQKSGWFDCGPADNTVATQEVVQSLSGAMRVQNGGCLYQEVSISANKAYSLSCQALRAGQNWTVVEFSFLDAEFNVLSDRVKQVNRTGSFSEYAVNAVAPANAQYALALLYSEDDTIFDSCELALSTGDTSEGSNESNLLGNGGFEEDLVDWQVCSSADLSTVSSEALTGSKAALLNNGGCLYQEFSVISNFSYLVQCNAKLGAENEYSSISLAMQDANYNTLNSREIAVTSTDYALYKGSMSAAGESSIGTVVLYSESASAFDDCSVVVVQQD